jgi:hypothetical protein
VALSQQEFEALLNDCTKRIQGNLSWTNDLMQTGAKEFRAAILSDADYPIFINARYVEVAGKLTYAVIHQSEGRIYGLDLGAIHRNPRGPDGRGELLRGTHKHRWTEQHRDKWAYVPPDITQPWSNPVAVWEQFCAEAGIQHFGTLRPPPTSLGNRFR